MEHRARDFALEGIGFRKVGIVERVDDVEGTRTVGLSPDEFPQARLKVELAAAPTEVGKSTRVTLDLASGKDTVKGDIELHVCWEITPEKK